VFSDLDKPYLLNSHYIIAKQFFIVKQFSRLFYQFFLLISKLSKSAKFGHILHIIEAVL